MERRLVRKLRIVAPALGLALVAPPAAAADRAETHSTRCSFARLPRLGQGTAERARREDDAPDVIPVPMEPMRPQESPVPWNRQRPDPLPEPPFLGRVPGEEIVAVPIEIGPEEGRHQCAPPALRVRFTVEIEWRRR